MVRIKATRFSSCILLLLTLLASSLAWASDQKASWETRHEADPVIYLLAEKIITIDEDYSHSEQNHSIVKVQTEGGKQWGEITTRYDALRQKVSDIEAFTITPGGEKIKADRVQDVNQSGDSGIYSDERQKIVTMPQVVLGSVLDFKSIVKTKKPVIDKQFYHQFPLTSPFPAKKSRYVITAPMNIPLTISARNTDIKPSVKLTDDTVTYEWEMIEPAKIRNEDYMPSLEEINKTVVVSTLKDWAQLSGWAWGLFSKNLKSSPELKATVHEITKNKTTPENKIQAIIEYVQKNMRYVAMHVDAHGYEPYPADRVFKLKYGDCKDHTVLGMAMLAELGIEARPVLLGGAKEIDRSAFLPMPSYFDHAIIHFELNGKKHYLDLLERGYSLGSTPARLAGRQVFVVTESGGFFDRIPESAKDDVAMIGRESFTIKTDGHATVAMHFKFSNDLSVAVREILKLANADQREKFLASIEAKSSQGGEVSKRSWDNIDVPYQPVHLNMHVERKNYAQVMGDLIMFGPNPVVRNALFSAPSREYPIVISAPAYMENFFSFAIPTGFEIINLPKPVILTTDFATYIREFSASGSTITGREVIEYKPARVAASEYQKIKAFYNDMTNMTNSKIVIKKKG